MQRFSRSNLLARHLLLGRSSTRRHIVSNEMASSMKICVLGSGNMAEAIISALSKNKLQNMQGMALFRTHFTFLSSPHSCILTADHARFGNLSSYIPLFLSSPHFCLRCTVTTSLLSPDISCYDINPDRIAHLKSLYGITPCQDVAQGMETADITFLSVKPQNVTTLAKSLNKPPRGLLLSIVAGCTVENLQTSFKTNKIVRSMPNTPAMVLEGTILPIKVHYPQVQLFSLPLHPLPPYVLSRIHTPPTSLLYPIHSALPLVPPPAYAHHCYPHSFSTHCCLVSSLSSTLTVISLSTPTILTILTLSVLSLHTYQV